MMKVFALLVFIGAVVTYWGAASARTIFLPRPPDTRLFVTVPPEKLAQLRVRLLEFATQEHLSEFRDARAPRAQGKQFYLSLYSDKFIFIAEKTPAAQSVMIECTDVDSEFSRAQARMYKVPYENESPFGEIVSRLKARLKSLSSDITEER